MRYTFHNRVMNPVVAAVLRSPLHAAMSRTNALMTCRGRRTGRAYTLPLRYAQDGSGLWIHPAKAGDKRWWRNLEGGAPVTIRLRGRDFSAHAEAIRDDGARVAEGMWAYYRRFPMLAKSMGLSWDPSSVALAASHGVMVRIVLGREVAPQAASSPVGAVA